MLKISSAHTEQKLEYYVPPHLIPYWQSEREKLWRKIKSSQMLTAQF